MSKKKLSSIVGLITFVGIATLIASRVVFKPVPLRNVRLEFSGTEGLKISGTYTADSKEHALSGEVPFDVKVQARSVSYVINKDQPGEMIVSRRPRACSSRCIRGLP